MLMSVHGRPGLCVVEARALQSRAFRPCVQNLAKLSRKDLAPKSKKHQKAEATFLTELNDCLMTRAEAETGKAANGR